MQQHFSAYKGTDRQFCIFLFKMSEESGAVPLPSWLKADLFEKLLSERFGDEFLAIRSFKPVDGLQPGENYSTIMLRLHFEVELKGESPPQEASRSDQTIISARSLHRKCELYVENAARLRDVPRDLEEEQYVRSGAGCFPSGDTRA